MKQLDRGFEHRIGTDGRRRNASMAGRSVVRPAPVRFLPTAAKNESFRHARGGESFPELRIDRYQNLGTFCHFLSSGVVAGAGYARAGLIEMDHNGLIRHAKAVEQPDVRVSPLLAEDN